MPPLKAHELLIQRGLEHCKECHCAVGDDWEFKDFSNKEIIVCPQCKTEYYTDDFPEEKTFFFKIHGKISGNHRNESDATDYLYELLKNKAEFQIDSVEEEED